MKDYYKIMNVPYDASAEDIRRAYHSFAKKYHPDKNGGPSAASLFLDIQEAYQTLSDEQRRRSFHLKTHYPLPSTKRANAVSTEIILQHYRQLKIKIQETNQHRLNPVFIATKLDVLLSEKNIKILLLEKKIAELEGLVTELLPVLKLLPYRLVVLQTGRLLRLSAHNPVLQQQIIAFGNRKRRLRHWEKYNLLIVLVATLLLCVLIIFLSE